LPEKINYKKLYEELQSEVTCDFYEAYLREKKKREKLEDYLNKIGGITPP